MKKIILIVILFATYGVTQAQKPAVVTSPKAGWHKIATQRVSLKTEKDEVVVMGNDRFKQIKLMVSDASVDLMSFNVYFEGDKSPMQKVAVGKVLNPGEESATIQLTHNLPVKKVVLVYKTISTGSTEKERAEVEIWGLK